MESKKIASIAAMGLLLISLAGKVATKEVGHFWRWIVEIVDSPAGRRAATKAVEEVGGELLARQSDELLTRILKSPEATEEEELVVKELQKLAVKESTKYGCRLALDKIRGRLQFSAEGKFTKDIIGLIDQFDEKCESDFAN